MNRRRRVPGFILAFAATLGLAACGPGAGASPTTATPSVAPRIASPAQVEILQPVSGATVSGTSVPVALKLTGAQIVQQTTTAIRPDQGHVHLYVDNVLVSMNYGLEQDI